jgi:hypothetical protein
MNSNIKKFSTEQLIVIFLVVAGVLISLAQFLQNREFLLDESQLAINIMDRNFIELLKPLDFLQVAPILFLYIEKVFSFLISNSEYGFRLFPLLCYWASFFFLLKFLKNQINNIYAIIIILSFYAFNNLLLIHSSVQAKQYMSDVFLLLVIYYITTKDYKTEKNKFYLLGFLGVIFIFLSNVAPLILFTSGVYLFYEEFFVSKRKRILPLMFVSALWLGAFAIYYFFFIANHPTREFMSDYWSYTFLPHDSFVSVYGFFIERSDTILNCFFPYSLPLIIKLIPPLAGLTGLILKKKVKLLILICVPILLHLIISGFGLYPFDLRLMLYLFPCIIILISMGIYYLSKVILSRFSLKLFKGFIVIVPIVLMVYYFCFCLPKQKKREVKETLEFVDNNINDDESVYLHYFVRTRYIFYKEIGYIKNIKSDKVFEGRYTDFITYKGGDLSEFDNLHGKTWLLISGQSDEDIIIHRLDSLGLKKLNEFHLEHNGTGSSAYLYDFGE